MKPLTADEMRKALADGEREAAKLGRSVVIVHNRHWDRWFNQPWRVKERAESDDIVIVRDVLPTATAA